MDAIWTAVGTVTATIALAVSSFFATSAPAEPAPKSITVVTVCGSGGLVPPNAENKCQKP